MKTVVYASSALDEINYQRCVETFDKTDQQAQRFNRSILRGFVENNINAIAISYRRTESELPKSAIEKDVKYQYLDCGTGLLRHIRCLLKAYKATCVALSENDDAIMFADGLSVFVCWGALLSSKKYKMKRYAFVTDLPGIYNKGLSALLNKLTLSWFDGYVFLTEAMSDILNKKHKPYIVMEGIYSGNLDAKKEEYSEAKRTEKKRLLYAGILDEKYGVGALLDSFDYLDDNVEINLFGTGDCVDRINERANKDERIKYWGVCDNNFVVKMEMEMDLLVNPRSKNELFTQYSFPSKTIEYMSTGIPVLMQKLPGMPEEYCKYLFLYEGDSPMQIADAIKKVLDNTNEKLISLGERAQEFILVEKNSKKQIKKVIDFVNAIPNE